MGQKKGNLMGSYYLVKPYEHKNILCTNPNKNNYVAARTELSERITKECVKGVTCGMNSMYKSIYNNIFMENGYEKTRKRLTISEWYSR